MPIRKFRSVEEMPPIRATDVPVAERLRRLDELRARAALLAPRRYPRGLFKFRSLEEAQESRERVTRENIQRLARERAERERGQP